MFIVRFLLSLFILSQSFASSGSECDETTHLHRRPVNSTINETDSYESFAINLGEEPDDDHKVESLDRRLAALEKRYEALVDNDEIVVYTLNKLMQFKQSWGEIFLLLGSGSCVLTASLMEQYYVAPELAGWLFVASGIIFVLKGLHVLLKKCRHALAQEILSIKEKTGTITVV